MCKKEEKKTKNQIFHHSANFPSLSQSNKTPPPCPSSLAEAL